VHLKRFRINYDSFLKEKINERLVFGHHLDLFPFTAAGVALADELSGQGSSGSASGAAGGFAGVGAGAGAGAGVGAGESADGTQPLAPSALPALPSSVAAGPSTALPGASGAGTSAPGLTSAASVAASASATAPSTPHETARAQAQNQHLLAAFPPRVLQPAQCQASFLPSPLLAAPSTSAIARTHTHPMPRLRQRSSRFAAFSCTRGRPTPATTTPSSNRARRTSTRAPAQGYARCARR
jgi:hypothetical protein